VSTSASLFCQLPESGPEGRPKIDPKFEEVMEGDEVEGKEKLKSKRATGKRSQAPRRELRG
jgi:hypothetical protein